MKNNLFLVGKLSTDILSFTCVRMSTHHFRTSPTTKIRMGNGTSSNKSILNQTGEHLAVSDESVIIVRGKLDALDAFYMGCRDELIEEKVAFSVVYECSPVESGNVA